MYIPFRQLLLRKIISAGITTFLFSIIYAWLEPDPFGARSIHSISAHSHEAFRIINVYMLYAAPAIYIYGTATSMASELITRSVAHRQWLRLTISTLLHCGFGLILLRISLLAALIFLISDIIIALNYKQPLTLKITLASLILPICLWLASVAYINMTG
ncbi:hypothetical protein GC102_32975 [Paenibacillus sp. LMG 31460]|uniref:DUF4386 domain-containing protein n=1 Tax=Paenibacillus germinis TaxID=2654979 RepID=A0ABX1ZB08_9BACL|nr:hypothetical protein [Paenibacillus germinis]NOU90517.1 hypothetical protein [Paenibacillus germinis]